MYQLYMKEVWSQHWGWAKEMLIVLDDLIVGHVRCWDRNVPPSSTWDHPYERLWIEQVLPIDISLIRLGHRVEMHMQEWAEQVAEERGIQHWASVCDIWAREGREHEPSVTQV
jgi:hypothetical protein